MNNMERLTLLEKQLKTANDFRKRSEGAKASYEEQLTKLNEDIKKMNISDVSEIEQCINDIDKQISTLLDEIENVLPKEVLEKYCH